MSETFHLCEVCKQIVKPAAAGSVRAVKLINADTMSERGDIEGLGVFFHVACWGNGLPGYRLKS